MFPSSASKDYTSFCKTDLHSKMNSIINNMGWSLLGKLVRLSLNVIVLGQIILFLGYETYGEVLLLLTIQSYCAIVSSAGAEVNLGKTVVKHPERKLLETVLTLKICLSAIIASSIFLFHNSAESIFVFACLLGGLSFLNIIEIKLSAEHRHREAILRTLGVHILSFIIKITMISFNVASDILIYYLLAEGLLVSLIYLGFINIYDVLRFRIDRQYLKEILASSLRFVPQRFSFIFASTCALFFCRDMYESSAFGEIAASFKIVGFCYLLFATLASSFEKVIYGKRNRIDGFVMMYQAMLVLYLAVIVGTAAAWWFQELIQNPFLGVFINELNAFAMFVSLPFFLSVGLNKWYVLNSTFSYLLIQNLLIVFFVFLLSFFHLEYGVYQFWMIVGVAYSLGITSIALFDRYRARHFLILRRVLWPRLRY